EGPSARGRRGFRGTRGRERTCAHPRARRGRPGDGKGEVTMASTTKLEQATGELATRVASGMSRRSFLGKVTRFAVVIVGAGVGVEVFASPALALTCNCTGRRCDAGCTGDRYINCQQNGHSVTCTGLTGHAYCP